MAIIGNTRFVERSRFFNGQRLFAGDLQSIEEFNRQMRWLHNQTLHQPGIGAGFATSGGKGDRQVVIEPGYAIDALGREIVLTESIVQPVPPVAADEFGGPVFFDLTVSYPDERTLDASETRAGVCGAATGAIRLREAPVFCWVRLGPTADRLPKDPQLRSAVVQGLHLRLARAQVLNCQLDRPLSLAQRRNAKPPEQPYVACASVGKLDWTVADAAVSRGVGAQVTASIDTSRAGFRTTPCYSAQAVGDRQFAFVVKGKNITRLVDGFVMLLATSKSSFAFSMWIPDALLTKVPANPADPNPQTDDADFRQQLTTQLADKWVVQWIGVEG